MKNLLKYLQLIPMIVPLVQAAEALVPLPQKGKEKLDFILASLTQVYGDVSDVLPQVKALISSLVALANATGVFHKAPESPLNK